MDQNGFNNNNFFQGPVFIEGNTDIDGNLDVTGTINGGGGGGVNNPMTSDLNAANYSILNLSEIKSSANSEIKTNTLNLQNNNILATNSIHLNLIEGINNSISMFGDVSIITSLNLLGNQINNIGNLKAFSPLVNLNLDFIPTSAGSANQVLGRDSAYNSSNPNTFKLVWHTPSVNPLTTNLNCNSFSLTTANNIETKNISSSTGNININSTMIHTSSVNMNNNAIFNINGTTILYNGVDLKLDLCPATQGTASQVLTRDPAFNPANASTHKLVWRDPSMSGVNNPMTENLNCNNYSFQNINNIDTKTITNSGSITCSTPDFVVNNGVNLAPTNIKFTGKIEFTNPNATLTNLGGLIIDASQIKNNGSNINMSDLTDFANGIKINTLVPHSGTQITQSAPQINFFNSVSADTSIYIKGGIQFNNGFTIPEIRGDDLFIRGQTALGVATPLNLVGTVVSIGSAISTELVGTVNCQNRLNNLFNDNKMGTRNVRTSLYKMYGNNTITSNFNFVAPVQIDITNGPTIGLSVLKAGSMRSGDKLKIKLNTILSTSASANMDLYIYMGTSLLNKKLQTSFAMLNTSTAFTFSSFIVELDCIITGTTMVFDNTALLTVNKSNSSSRMTQGTATGVGQEIFTTYDNFIFIFAGVSSVIATANITIIGGSIEHY